MSRFALTATRLTECETGTTNPTGRIADNNPCRRAMYVAIHFKRTTPAIRRTKPLSSKHQVAGRKISQQDSASIPQNIAPESLALCLTELADMLQCKSEVLIVSKPHLEWIQSICLNFLASRKQIRFRFTNGATSTSLARLQKRNARPSREQSAAIQFATRLGFQASASPRSMHVDDRFDLVLISTGHRVADSTVSSMHTSNDTNSEELPQ
jgi:hypothetical protein